MSNSPSETGETELASWRPLLWPPWSAWGSYFPHLQNGCITSPAFVPKAVGAMWNTGSEVRAPGNMGGIMSENLHFQAKKALQKITKPITAESARQAGIPWGRCSNPYSAPILETEGNEICSQLLSQLSDAGNLAPGDWHFTREKASALASLVLPAASLGTPAHPPLPTLCRGPAVKGRDTLICGQRQRTSELLSKFMLKGQSWAGVSTWVWAESLLRLFFWDRPWHVAKWFSESLAGSNTP